MNKILKPVIDFFTALISSPELYLQFVLALAVILLALISSYYARKNAFRIRLKNENFDHWLKGALQFLTPVLIALFMTIATEIAEAFFKDSRIISHIARLSRAWLILNLIWKLSENKSVARFIVVMLVPILFLRIVGLFQPTAAYLDTLDFTIGKLRLSVYVLLKGGVALTILLWLTGIILSAGEQYIRKMQSISFNAKELLIKFFEIITYGIVFLVTLNVMGVDLTALAVFGGALGVGIGFGLQKITSNFFSGIILLAEKSIKTNDVIEIDNGITGTVKRLGARAILVETGDGREILIPNEDFITSKVTNWTYSHTRGRIEIKVGISYDSDITKARELMLMVAAENERCLNEPKPECFVAEFGDNAIKLALYFWVENIAKGRQKPKSQVMLAIWQKFAENNIKIPLTNQPQ